MLNTLIYAGIRTPFGRMGGGLAPIRPDDLLAGTFREHYFIFFKKSLPRFFVTNQCCP